jgi:outer membrane autotransporter protein
VKVNGFSGILGFGRTTAHGLTAGAFFEAGEGNYRTYNNIDGDFMRGDGEASYSGGGLLVRKDNANGVYAEASVRAGNLKNELRNAVKGSDGLAGYDINTFYYGAHLGLGVVIPRGSDGDSFDIYSKFIYTHHDSENFKIDGDEFHFDSVESERLRLGFRYNNVFDKLTMYCSAVWEYEFGGDADNTVVGYDLNTPSLKGSTVIGEIGTHYKATDNWSFDLNGRAYVGQREGVSGSLQVNYRF